MQYRTQNSKGVQIDQRVNDGSWHHAVMAYDKKKKSLSLNVNNEKEKVLKLRKSKVNRELYIGGLPDNIADLNKLVSSRLLIAYEIWQLKSETYSVKHIFMKLPLN